MLTETVGDVGGDDMGRNRATKPAGDRGDRGEQSKYVTRRWHVILPEAWRGVMDAVVEKYGGQFHVHVQAALVAYAKALGVPCPDEPIEPPRGKPPGDPGERLRRAEEEVERIRKQAQWKKDRAALAKKKPKSDT